DEGVAYGDGLCGAYVAFNGE
ncbi:hypothetical protein L195_g064544, partial [Trifolium pratense]